MEKFINATLKAGYKIAQILKSGEDSLYQRYSKGVGGDISIGADLQSERIFCEYLSPFGNIDSEESGFIDNGKEWDIIIDPLDGSDNFVSKIPYYGASVALCDTNLMTKVAVIMNFCDYNVVVGYEDKILKGRLGERLSDFREQTFNKVAKCGIFERAYSNPHICQILSDNHIKFRSLGALALSLGLANEVNFIIFMGKSRKYDICAGMFIAKKLYKIVDKNIILMSKDKKLFDKISKLLSLEK